MSTPQTTDADPSTLFQPGERLGWVFRDRNLFRRRFTEPAPAIAPPLTHLHHQLQRSRMKLPGRMTLAVLVFIFTAPLFVAALVGDPDLAGLAAMPPLGALAFAIALVVNRVRLKRQVATAEQERQRSWAEADAAWKARKAAFDRREHQRIDQLVEWGAAAPPEGTGRIDIVGGDQFGWEALLTVYGASLISTRPTMTVVDMSRDKVSVELAKLVGQHHGSVDALVLPDELAHSDLLVGLDSRDLVDALIEAIFAGEPAVSRADRAMADRILTAICSVLGSPASFAQLGEALRTLMGEPAGPGSSLLEPDQRRFIADELFSDQYRRNAHEHLSRLESFLHPLAELGARHNERPPATLTCLAMAPDGHTVRHELLKELVVQWLIRSLTRAASRPGSLLIAGADDVPARHLERLGDLCQRHDVRLVLLFRHLRGAAQQAIGSGVVGFMRLGNHEEARQAAEFIGREHRFELSQLTNTLGGNETHTHSETDSTSDTEQRSVGSSRGRFWSVNRNRSWGVTRTTGHTRSRSGGSSWSEATARQRVYEYAVEPRTIQQLPDYALIMVSRGGDGPPVLPVECNPGLIELPRLSMEPLPALALPGGLEEPEPALVAQPAAPDWRNVPPRRS